MQVRNKKKISYLHYLLTYSLFIVLQKKEKMIYKLSKIKHKNVSID